MWSRDEHIIQMDNFCDQMDDSSDSRAPTRAQLRNSISERTITTHIDAIFKKLGL